MPGKSLESALRPFQSCCLSILALSTAGVFIEAAEPDHHVGTHAASVVWDQERQGWQVGAKLLNVTKVLEPGDPAVVQFLLRNVSDRERTVELRDFARTTPVLGAGNRINLNISSQGSRHQHTLAAGEILDEPQYRVTVSTQGLPPGVYELTAQPAFWQTKEGQSNSAVGIGRKIPLRITVGDPRGFAVASPPTDDDPKTRIYWGEPVMGLVVGMRLPQGQESWPSESRIEAELFVRNVSDRPIEFEYEIPGATDWNMNVERTDGARVRLDWVSYSGIRLRVTRSLKLAPEQQEPLTGITAEVRTAGLALIGRKPKSEKKRIPGPTLQVLREKSEFQPGDPRRLIATAGSFTWQAWITIRQARSGELPMVVGGNSVPFEIRADTAN